MNLKNTLEPVVTVQDIKHKWGLKDDRKKIYACHPASKGIS